MRYLILVSIVLLLNMPDCMAQREGIALSADNSPIHYKIFGTGKPLLIINGGPGMNSEGFADLARMLAPRNMAIIYDQRGTGRSSVKILDTSTITMQLMIDDIESLRRSLKIEKWSVLGHSFGGMVASYYATQYPGSIDKMILSSSGGVDLDLLNYVSRSINSKLSKAESDSVNYWNAIISRGDTSYQARIGRARNLAPAYVYDKRFVPVIAERLTQGNARINQLIWDDLRKIGFHCAEKLRSFMNPVLIIQGKQDIVKAETAGRSHLAFRNSRVVFMEHCVHYGWLDNKEEYLKEINAFLSED